MSREWTTWRHAAAGRTQQKSKRWTHCCKYCRFYFSELDCKSLNNMCAFQNLQLEF